LTLEQMAEIAADSQALVDKIAAIAQANKDRSSRTAAAAG
jgi:hypothetical protein